MRDDEAKVWGVVGLFALAVMALTAAAHELGLDRESFMRLVGWLIGWAVLFGGVTRYFGLHSLRPVWPMALGSLWLCFWPAVTYWGVNHIGSDASLLAESTLQEVGERAVWSTTPFILGVTVAILIVGYAIDRDARFWTD